MIPIPPRPIRSTTRYFPICSAISADSGVLALQLDDLAEAEHGDREIAAGRDGLQDVADAAMLGRLAHGNTLDLEDDVAAHHELLAHDRGEHRAADEADSVAGRAPRHRLHEIARRLWHVEDLRDWPADEPPFEPAPERRPLQQELLGRVD